jgi:hypothetical protein
MTPDELAWCFFAVGAFCLLMGVRSKVRDLERRVKDLENRR